LLSFGGWLYSLNFATLASTALSRSAFASSAVSLVKSLGLDGINIDWEYPGDDIEATNIVELSLNPLYRFTLTVACPAGPLNYQKLHVANMISTEISRISWHTTMPEIGVQ
jgi:chitinase